MENNDAIKLPRFKIVAEGMTCATITANDAKEAREKAIKMGFEKFRIVSADLKTGARR